MWINNRAKLEYLFHKHLSEGFRGKQSEQREAEAFIRKLVEDQSKEVHKQIVREMELLKSLREAMKEQDKKVQEELNRQARLIKILRRSTCTG